MSTTSGPTASQASPRPGGPVTRLDRIARWCYVRRRAVLGIWLGALVGVTALSFVFAGVFADKFNGGNSESARAQALLSARFPARAGDSADVVFRTADPVTSPVTQAAITRTLDGLRGLPEVASVRSPFDPGGQAQIGRDGHIAYGVVQFDKITDNLPKPAIQKVVDRARASAAPGFDVELGGSPSPRCRSSPSGPARVSASSLPS